MNLNRFRKIQNGKVRATGQNCTVFTCDEPGRLQLASTSVKKLKTLRHPAILSFIEASEVEGKSVSLATERVVPLSSHLHELDTLGLRGPVRDKYVAWGVYQVLRGLAFLNVDAKIRHNAIHMDAIFVNEAGDFKIFALENVSPSDSPENLPGSIKWI